MEEKKGAKTKLELVDYFHFKPGVDEIRENVTIGSLDIKISLPTNASLSDDSYFAIEYKRINKLANIKTIILTTELNDSSQENIILNMIQKLL